MSQPGKHFIPDESLAHIEQVEEYFAVVDEAEVTVIALIGDSFPSREITYAWFDSKSGKIVPRYATGGWAYNPSIVSLAIDEHCMDHARIRREISEITYHELFHIAQGFTFVDEHSNPLHIPLLGNAIYEGAASIFERDYARADKSLPYYADYMAHQESDLVSWLEELKKISNTEETIDQDLLRQWKFYHEELGVNHIMYKVGAYIVDTALKKTERSVALIANEPWQKTWQRFREYP